MTEGSSASPASPAAPDRRAIITEALRKIDDLTARLAAAEKAETEPIAVVGIGARLPGGVGNADEFWQLLLDGGNGVIRVPADRWDADEFYSPDYSVPGTICNREGGFLTSWQPDEFDAEFFSISPREAAGMDPQQRLLMEVAVEALEDANINPRTLRGSATGVFVGLTANDYFRSVIGTLAPEEIDPYIPFGNAPNFAAGRLSYFLGVRGPAVVSDTACSSSLVSIHLACQSLRRGESDHALAAGVNLILSPENNIACSRWGMLSPQGRCATFDADADGYVRSEGCGVVVLKRLTDALRDGDRVLAVVRGSAVNQDGASSGQTVPNGPAQQELMRTALRSARLEPSDIDYIEAHGTGTGLGDPIELDALSAVYGDRKDSAPLVLGSVKTNLGHLESAAGVTGFIKTVLSVQHGFIPKQLHFTTLTPQAGEGASKFHIAAEPMQWPAHEGPRRAAVSSFGVSGTNAHIVIEQAPETETVAPQPEPPVSTLVVTGKTPARVASLAGALADWLQTPHGAAVSLADVAETLNHHRAQHARFATVAAADRDQAVAGLRALAGGYPAPGVAPVHDGACGSGTVFLYSGQGSQWAGMGRRLLADEPAFAAAVDELEPDFVAQAGFSLRDVLSSGETVVGIDRIQPVLVGVQLALTALWRSYGVTPDAVIGHSMGEVTAAVVAGALSPADGLKVIATRSRLMKRLSGQGAMALLELDAEAAEKLIADYDGLTVAVYASPHQTVIAGPPDQVDAAIAVVDAQDRLARRVDVDVASHHPIIDPILDDLRAELATLQPRTPTIPVIVTTDGRPTDGGCVFDADHWVANLRNPVRFARAVATAGAQRAVFVEVSPHPLLGYAIKGTLASLAGDENSARSHHHSIATLQRDANDTVTFHTNLNATHTTRPPKTPPRPGPRVQIPTTPWHHSHHWIHTAQMRDAVSRTTSEAPAAKGEGGYHEWLHQLSWPVCELGAARSDGAWLVLTDEPGLAPALGTDARTLPLSALETDAAALRTALGAAQFVAYAPSAPSQRFDAAAAYRVFGELRRLVPALAGMSSAPKLFVVTRNAQPVVDGDRANPAHAVLWGQGRTLALENPEFWGGLVDVDETLPPELLGAYLRAEASTLDAADRDDQAVYRAGERRVPRLEPRALPAVPLTRLEGGTSHLVVGATGNVGPYLIRQLADMGASTVVAVSRRGTGLAELAAELARTGTTLVEVAADAADEASMAAVFDRFGRDLPPLDGVYLASLAGGEALLTDMTDDDLRPMFRSKVDAATVLHKLSLTTPVRRFVLFSSITGLLGSRAVAHYTAANAFADAFAYARRALGLPATVVDWGLWKSWSDAQPQMKAAGLEPMPNDVAIRMLPTVLSPDAGTHVVLAGADWHRLADAYRMRAAVKVLDHLVAAPADSGADLDAVAAPAWGTVLGDEVAGTAHDRLWQAKLLPGARSYPVAHRVRGVEVVPVSVLLQTLSTAAGKIGGSTVGDVRFEYPIVADAPKVVHVVLSKGTDGETLTVWSSARPDSPEQRWTRHAGARLVDAPGAAPQGDQTPRGKVFDGPAIAEMQRAWGVEGQPFDWTVSDCTATAAGARAGIELPAGTESPAAALVDAAVHVARLADAGNAQLLLPGGAESLSEAAGVAGTHGVIEVFRRADRTDALVVDAIVTGADGTVWVDLRGLTYAPVESAPAPSVTDSAAPPAEFVEWSAMTPKETVAELRVRLRAILARELGMPEEAVDFDAAFPELGLDSMMAMNLLRDAKALVRIDLSATMLWNHPSISQMSEFVAELLAPQQQAVAEAEPEPDDQEPDDDGFSLDDLFDSIESSSVESANAGSEGAI
ncbi:polyketide synthase family protein [Mycolicibacterium chubuense NBB4]|uniref:Polyketide synthase family protein n=1 Tax=Mycolicibacterium chubuense (strain NBB4) TaxID=710421 RepID=I4BJR7_MYCCN|nr:type I polyketide synthase [Mycolicibacterium chubuense]AFM17524.1 polyketide synthase family protein [Mycolicibacterium chubuense NBB4]